MLASLLASLFAWPAERAAALVGSTPEEEALRQLLAAEDPPPGVSRFVFLRARPELDKALRRLPLREWAAAHRVPIDDMSLFELQTVAEVNPYYCMFAFRTKFDACFELSGKLGLKLPPDMVMYAMAWDMLLKPRKLDVAVVHDELRRKGLVPEATLDKAAAFPAAHLAGHALFREDPDAVPEAYLKAKITDHRCILSSIRERKYMVNRLVVVNGQYGFRTQAAAFTEAIYGLLEPEGKDVLGRRLRKAYKKMRLQDDSDT